MVLGPKKGEIPPTLTILRFEYDNGFTTVNVSCLLLCFIEPIVGNRGPGDSEPGDTWISLNHHLNYVGGSTTCGHRDPCLIFYCFVAFLSGISLCYVCLFVCLFWENPKIYTSLPVSRGK